MSNLNSRVQDCIKDVEHPMMNVGSCKISLRKSSQSHANCKSNVRNRIQIGEMQNSLLQNDTTFLTLNNTVLHNYLSTLFGSKHWFSSNWMLANLCIYEHKLTRGLCNERHSGPHLHLRPLVCNSP